jgi:hypothetical protein
MIKQFYLEFKNDIDEVFFFFNFFINLKEIQKRYAEANNINFLNNNEYEDCIEGSSSSTSNEFVGCVGHTNTNKPIVIQLD